MTAANPKAMLFWSGIIFLNLLVSACTHAMKLHITTGSSRLENRHLLGSGNIARVKAFRLNTVS